jgi:hypothetical protein
VLSFVSVSTSMLFWVIFLLSFSPKFIYIHKTQIRVWGNLRSF